MIAINKEVMVATATNINELFKNIKTEVVSENLDAELEVEVDPELEVELEVEPEDELQNEVFNVDSEIDENSWGKEDSSELDEDNWDNEPEPAPTLAPVIPEILSITTLSRNIRNAGFKLAVFNIKDTLIRYLEMFGERKIARHVLDKEGQSFYEIHAVYIPGAVIYKLLTGMGFHSLHPTDLDEKYSKDMRYEVAMTNGSIYINVFGGLQQHAPTEETVIRNLYDWEKKRFSIGLSLSSSIKEANTIIDTLSVNVSKNLMLAAMQSYSLDKKNIALEFFDQAMNSVGIDKLMNNISDIPTSFSDIKSGSYDRQPSYVEISDIDDTIAEENKTNFKITDDDRIASFNEDNGELFKYE